MGLYTHLTCRYSDFNKTSKLVVHTAEEEIKDNLLEFVQVGGDRIWNLRINFNLNVDISIGDISSGHFLGIFQKFLHACALVFGPESILRNIVDRLEIFNSISQFFQLEDTLVVKLLTLMFKHVLVHLLNFLFSVTGISINRCHELIGKFRHLTFGLHDFFVHDDRGYISYDEQFVVATGYPNINLIQSDVLWNLIQVFIIDLNIIYAFEVIVFLLGFGKKSKNGTSFIVG